MLDNVVILKRANRQFQNICDYLVDEFGESVADAFESEVERCVTTLVKFPEAGHPARPAAGTIAGCCTAHYPGNGV